MPRYRRSDRYKGNWNKPIFEDKNFLPDIENQGNKFENRVSDNKKSYGHTISGSILIWLSTIFIVISIMIIIVGSVSGIFGVTIFNTKNNGQNSHAKAQFATTSTSSKHTESKQAQKEGQGTSVSRNTTSQSNQSEMPAISSNSTSHSSAVNGQYALKILKPNGETSVSYFDSLEEAVNEGIVLVNSGQAINYWVTNN